MIRGVVAGFIAGTVVSGLALGALSLLTEAPGPPAPDAAAVDVPAGSGFDQTRGDRTDDFPQVDPMPGTGGASAVRVPASDDLSALSRAGTAPATAPVTGGAETAMVAPEKGQDPGVAVEGDSPVLPSPRAVPPSPPSAGEALAISSETAQVAPPENQTKDSAARPVVQAPDARKKRGVPFDAADEGAEEAVAKIGDQQAGEGAEEAAKRPQVAGEDSAAIGNRADGVTTGRLPAITEGSAPDAAATDAGQADAAQAPPADLPSLQRYAVAFDIPDDRPLMAIVLIDDGSSAIGAQALDSFPYPISFALDADWPGADPASRAYRAAGFEVLAMADLPRGAGAADVETAMQAVLRAVPGSVAVLEGPGRGLQSGRAVSEQLVPVLQDSGHGLVLQPSGLDTAQKLIAREGVPALTLFRDFDGEGQGVQTIRRFLDQAALRATQEDTGVIMLGRLRADTISALLLWGLQDRAGAVTLAPVSALLRATQATPGQ